jgi:hypothetical protein
VLGHPSHGVDAVEEAGELDLPAQGATGTFPSIEVGQGGVYLLIR